MTPGDRPQYNLDAAQFQQALAVLEEARETFQLGAPTQLLYRLLKWSVYGVVGSLVWLVIAALWAGATGQGGGAMVFLVLAPVVLLLLAVLSSPILLLLNVPLVYRIVKQQALLKRLGLKDWSISIWRAQRKMGVWKKIWVRLGLAIGLLFLLTALVMIGQHVMGEHGALPSAILALTVGGPIVAQFFVARAKEQIELVASAAALEKALRALHQKAGGGDAAVAVPAEALERIARLESASISRQRAQAVVASAEAGAQGYGVLVARDVLSEKARLESGSRLQVEELIEQVGANPRAGGATEDPAQGLWRLKTGDGAFELAYAIDDARREVRLVGLSGKSVPQGGARHTRLNGAVT